MEDMNFGSALALLKNGCRVAHIDMRTANGQVVPWSASQTDLLRDDWCVVS